MDNEELKATRIINGSANKEEIIQAYIELKKIELAHQKENGKLRKQIKEYENRMKEEIQKAREYYKSSNYTEDAIYRIWRGY